MLERLPITLIVIYMISGNAHAQTDADRWILNQIDKDKPFNSEIFWMGNHSMPMLPHEEPDNRSRVYIHHVVINRNGLFLNIDGTGKLFKWIAPSEGKEPEFVRQDSSRGYGYNYQGFVFSRHDTIFSIGGYGYWNHNWNLRYYSTASRGWELMPVSHRIWVSGKDYGIWLDQSRGQLFLASKDSIVDEGLISYQARTPIRNSPFYVYRLVLNTRTWHTLGILSAEAAKLYEYPIRVASSPFGEMLIQDSKHGFAVRFINAASNRVLELKDKELSTRIYYALFNPKMSSAHDRHITYFHDSTLTVLLGNKTRFDFSIDSTDLKVLPFKVYEPLPDEAFYWSSLPWWLAGAQSVLIIALIILVLRRKTAVREGTNAEEPQSFFDSHEIRVLQAFRIQPAHSLSTDQIDEILGTTNKSMDLKNKRRSLVIRSINQKYQERLETDAPLIRTTRMETDRRMVQYILQMDNYQKAAEWMN